MAYQGNPVETNLPVRTENIVDGTILETDLAAAVVVKLNLASTKQDTLVSGTNVKTFKGQTILGSGDIVPSEDVVIVGTNTTAVRFSDYVLTASITLTLPATPTAGDWVRVIDRSGTTTSVVARNGSNIMGLAEDFTVDLANFAATFLYADATRGWVIV